MMTFYGGALGVKRSQHALLDSLVNLFPFKIAKIVNIISNVLMFGLVVVVLIGLQAIMGIAKHQVSAAMQLPMVYIYILMFIGMTVMLIFITEKIIETAQMKEKK
jgi:TRAP-type C4-dicarboxylate transport system permease small subunit